MHRAVDLEQSGTPVCRQTWTETDVTAPAKESGNPEHPHRPPSVVRTPWKNTWMLSNKQGTRWD